MSLTALDKLPLPHGGVRSGRIHDAAGNGRGAPSGCRRLPQGWSQPPVQSLTSTLASFSDSITETLLTVMPGPARALSPVKKSSTTTKWILQRDVYAFHAPESVMAMWKKLETRFNVKISETAFGSGGERNAFELRFLGADGAHKSRWVAKRSKYIITDQTDEIRFHRKNLVAQSVAGAYATRFSVRIKSINHDRLSRGQSELPAIAFHKCYLLVLSGEVVFVEEMLMDGKFIKVRPIVGVLS